MNSENDILEYLKTVESRLSLALRSAPLSSAEVFRRANVSRDYLRNIRRAIEGRKEPFRPKRDKLEALARVLEISVDYIEGTTDDPSLDIDDLAPQTQQERDAIKILRALNETNRANYLINAPDGLSERLHRIAGDIRALALQFPDAADGLMGLGDHLDREITARFFRPMKRNRINAAAAGHEKK